MAKLIKCKSCNQEISKNAKICPNCGEPTPKKTSILTWFVLILFIIGVANIDTKNTATNSSYTSPSKTPKELAKNLVSIESFNWSKKGFGNIMEISFKIKNDSKFTVKDIKIECDSYSKSKTKIDSNIRTIYDIVEPNSKKNFPNFNMGFINSQANSSTCIIIDFNI